MSDEVIDRQEARLHRLADILNATERSAVRLLETHDPLMHESTSAVCRLILDRQKRTLAHAMVRAGVERFDHDGWRFERGPDGRLFRRRREVIRVADGSGRGLA